jgi:hypothetical protein
MPFGSSFDARGMRPSTSPALRYIGLMVIDGVVSEIEDKTLP